MTRFATSNGVVIDHSILPNPPAPRDNIPLIVNVSERESDALAELFRSRDDNRLGRWRSPENADFVVYGDQDENHIRVVNEIDGENITFARDFVNPCGSTFAQVALAFFEAHPESKPWHKAQQGEVWVVTRPTTYDWETPTTVRTVTSSRRFADVSSLRPAFDVTSSEIVAAERIWPKDAA